MFKILGKGDFKKTKDFLRRMQTHDQFSDFNRYGEIGLAALEKSTPKDTAETANSWSYRIINNRNRPGIEWFNTNEDERGISVAILIQYGHATGTGGYVSGRDFINPAMRPVFDKIADEVWKKVMKA